MDCEPKRSEELLPLVYCELRDLAARQLADERVGHTLSPTALVHEAYLRLVAANEEGSLWNSRGHFYGAAAQAMRRVLVDSARRRGAARRITSQGQPVPLGDLQAADVEVSHELLSLDAALTRLEQADPDLARLVHLRFFAGLTMADVADLLGLSLRNAERKWSYARAWLSQSMQESD